MEENKRFAVYSDSREGFLIGVGPSLWHYDGECAIRFETEKEARTAASRRQADLAVTVRLIELDGGVEFEPLLSWPKLRPHLDCDDQIFQGTRQTFLPRKWWEDIENVDIT